MFNLQCPIYKTAVEQKNEWTKQKQRENNKRRKKSGVKGLKDLRKLSTKISQHRNSEYSNLDAKISKKISQTTKIWNVEKIQSQNLDPLLTRSAKTRSKISKTQKPEVKNLQTKTVLIVKNCKFIS